MWGRHLMMLDPNGGRHQNRISATSGTGGVGAGAWDGGVGRETCGEAKTGQGKDRKVTTYIL